MILATIITITAIMTAITNIITMAITGTISVHDHLSGEKTLIVYHFSPSFLSKFLPLLYVQAADLVIHRF